MKPIFYYLRISSPCRAVQLALDVLDIDVEQRHVDLFQGEHLTPEFLKLNPYHTVPTYHDDKITLSESRAIMAYLVNRHAPNSTLYPSDAVDRAHVDRALFWEASSLYPAVRAIIFPIIRGGGRLDTEACKVVDEKLKVLNEELGRTKYFGSDKDLTIADLSLLATWTAIVEAGFWQTSELKNIHQWFNRIKESKRIKNWDEYVVKSAQAYGSAIKSRLSAN